MLRVALTGNIASGKSTVARLWQHEGAPIIDADVLARRAVAPGTRALRRIVEQFGAGILDDAGGVDRAALRRIVFRDPVARRRLEAIVHPEIARLRDEEERRLRAAGEPIVVHDVPLLFEAGLQEGYDVIVVVDAPEEVRLRRLVRERGLDEGEARRMIDAQLPTSQKRGRADYVIDNGGTPEDLERRAVEVWRKLRRRVDGYA